MLQDQTDQIIKAGENIPNLKEGLEDLKNFSFNDFIGDLSQRLVNFAINVAIALAVFYIGKFIIKRLYNLVGAILVRRKVDQSLTTFVLSFVKIVLYFILIITVVGILGIETTSFLALFASAGVAIGMALSGTLQNFAGGVLILLLKPYKIGDYIEAQGYGGTVKEIQIFHTIITTPDNKGIILPNGALSTSSINNWSREEYRRVSWTIAISYNDSVAVARKAIEAMFECDHRIIKDYIDGKPQFEDGTGKECVDGENDGTLTAGEASGGIPDETPEKKKSWLYRATHRHRRRMRDVMAKVQESRLQTVKVLQPRVVCAPSVQVNELADSSVNLIVKAWVETSNYWPVFFDYNEKFYTELPKCGINFPFPQMDVHIKPVKETAISE